MKKLFVFLVCFGTFLFFTSCQKELPIVADPVIAELEDAEWSQIKNDAFKAFEDAQAEFFAGVPSAFDAKKFKPKSIQEIEIPPLPDGASADSVVYTPVISDEIAHAEITPEEYGVLEKIQALAWEAQQTEDDTKLVNYLKEEGLYDKFQEIAARYNLEQHAKNLSLRKKAISTNAFLSSAFTDGDIYLKYDKSSSGSSSGSSNNAGSSSGGSNILNWLIPGKWGHAAFLDAQNRTQGIDKCLLSASDETDAYKANKSGAIGRAGYDKVDGYWTKATEVAICRVRNASSAKRRNAIVYAKQFIGTPWTPITTRAANDKTYCSKLVYRGWLSQGYDLEPTTGWYSVPEFYWAYKKIWGIKIWYPAYRMVTYRDTWVTPTDLDECSATQRIATY